MAAPAQWEVIIFSVAGNSKADKYNKYVEAAKAVFGIDCVVIVKTCRDTVKKFVVECFFYLGVAFRTF